MKLTVGSLFSGIGGLDLGLEQAGMKTIWQVEYDDWARGTLNKNFPYTEKFKDVREVGKHNLRPVDLIAGGFPCQDISNSGKRIGIDGERSGLWADFNRIIREIRPRYVLVENVAALLDRGIGRVLGHMAEGGYDAEWECLPAAAFGAPHRRDRIFIVGYPKRPRLSTRIFTQVPTEMLAQRRRSRLGFEYGGAWDGEPELAAMVHGLPCEVAGTIGLGNAVCPPVAKWIGERIIEFHEARVNDERR